MIQVPLTELTEPTTELYLGTGKPLLDPALTNENEGNNVTKRIGGKIVMRPSSLDIGCHFKYAQTTLLGKKSKPAGASQLGTSYHYALELGFTHKLATQQNPNMNDLRDIGVMNWDSACNTMDLPFHSRGDSKEKARDDIANAIQTYGAMIPQVTPVAIETRFTVGLPKPSNIYSALSGSIDLLAEHQLGTVKIVDHKLTSAKKSPATYRMQTGLYETMGKTLGYQVAQTELHNAVRSKVNKTSTTPVKQHIINPTRDKPTYNIIEARITELVNRGELFHYLTTEKHIDPEMAVSLIYPTTSHEQHYLCSPEWCSFYSECSINNPSKFSNFSILDLMKSDGVS